MFSQYYILSGNLARIHFGKIGKDITLAKKIAKRNRKLPKFPLLQITHIIFWDKYLILLWLNFLQYLYNSA